MSYRFVDLVDIDAFRAMLQSFYDATGILHGLVDDENNVISAVGWQEACVSFHRANPLTNERCLESNRYLAAHLGEGAFVGCACRNGLMDYATPIVVEGRQLATLYFGQILNEPPDMEFFRRQAKEAGFDEDAYLAAIRKVPIVARERVEPIMAFYVQLAEMLARSGLDRLRQREAEQRLADLNRDLSRRVEERTAELRKQAEFRQLLLNGIGDAGLTVAVIENGRIVYRNESQFVRDFGYAKDEPLPDSFIDAVHPDDRERIADICRHGLGGETMPASYDVGLQLHNGERRDFEFFVTTIPETDPLQTLVLARDMTERKHMAAAIDKERATLRAFFTTLPDLAWMKDTEGRYLACNPVFERFFGAPEAEIVGKTDFDFVDAELAAFFRQKDREATAAGRPTANEEWITFASDGHRALVEAVKMPLRDAAGKVFGVLGISHDITERHAMETAREDALNEARRLAQARSAFLARMSHELRTPLNGILGYTQNLLRDPTTDKRQKASLTIIQQSGSHLLALIGDILDHAKIEADKVELYATDIPLADFLNSVCDVVRVRAEQKNLAFRCEIASALPGVVHGDEQRLRQVLLNLLSNAVKYTDAGEVVLRVDQAASGRMSFAVSDTGIGIAEAEQETIFQVFEQAGDERRHIGGTGLGLTISRQLARMMGGDISVESQPGAGSTFSFEVPLPAAATAAATPALTQSSAPRPTEPPKVEMIAPPHDEMVVLLELARYGNMKSIVERAEHIANLGAAYGPFAARLRHLAENYQSKALLALVEQLHDRQD